MKNTSILASTVAVVAMLAVGAGAAYWLRAGGPTNGGAATAPTAAETTTAPEVVPVKPDAVAALWRAPLTDVDGKPHGLDAYKGRVLVVNFWASWCGPCVREMPALAELSRQYAGKGVQFIGIGVDSEQNIQSFLRKVPVDYPIFVSGFGGADLARDFGNAAGGLPFTVVIDANGAVRSTKLGEIAPEELRHTLDTIRANSAV
jgi:thiol-disulfide isomerase/thioredoxin